jgi:hypothetical protein
MGPLDRVHDDLTVQAVLWSEGDTTLCLLVLDLLLLDRAGAGAIRTGVGTALGIPASAVLTSCTHTHSAPSPTPTTRLLRWPCPPALPGDLVRASVGAALAAREAATEATLTYARGALPGELSVNRRGHPYDPTFAVLQASTGVTLTNVGVHPVACGVDCRSVATDWVGPFRARMAERTGAHAVLVPGALGDVNPPFDPHGEPTPGGSFTEAAQLGSDVADAAMALLAEAQPLEGGLRTWTRWITPRTGLTIPSLLQRSAKRRVEVELAEWSVGGMRLVSLPGEGFHALGRSVEAARPGPTMVVGLAPWWQGYLPVPFGRGYEESMSLGRRFVAEVAAALAQPPG